MRHVVTMVGNHRSALPHVASSKQQWGHLRTAVKEIEAQPSKSWSVKPDLGNRSLRFAVPELEPRPLRDVDLIGEQVGVQDLSHRANSSNRLRRPSVQDNLRRSEALQISLVKEAHDIDFRNPFSFSEEGLSFLALRASFALAFSTATKCAADKITYVARDHLV